MTSQQLFLSPVRKMGRPHRSDEDGEDSSNYSGSDDEKEQAKEVCVLSNALEAVQENYLRVSEYTLFLDGIVTDLISKWREEKSTIIVALGKETNKQATLILNRLIINLLMEFTDGNQMVIEPKRVMEIVRSCLEIVRGSGKELKNPYDYLKMVHESKLYDAFSYVDSDDDAIHLAVQECLMDQYFFIGHILKHGKRLLDKDQKTFGAKILSKLCRYIEPNRYKQFIQCGSFGTITELHEMKEYKNQEAILLDAHALLIFREFKMNGRFDAIQKLALELDSDEDK